MCAPCGVWHPPTSPPSYNKNPSHPATLLYIHLQKHTKTCTHHHLLSSHLSGRRRRHVSIHAFSSLSTQTMCIGFTEKQADMPLLSFLCAICDILYSRHGGLVLCCAWAGSVVGQLWRGMPWHAPSLILSSCLSPPLLIPISITSVSACASATTWEGCALL